MTRRSATLPLALLLAINTLNFFDRQILPAVQERIRTEWGLKDTELVWLGTAFILLYAFVGLPLGRLADVWRRKWLLAAGVGLWSVLTVGSGLAWNFSSLFLMRLGVGIGEAACAPVASSWIGDLFPAEKRARAMAVFMLGLPLGLSLSFIVSSVIAERYGWEKAFFVAGAPGLLLAFAVLFIAEPARDVPATHRGAAPQQSFWGSVREVLSLPTIWWLIVSGAVHNFNMYALGTFMSSYLQRWHHLTMEQAGWVSGLVYGCGAVGIFLGGWLGDWALRWGVKWRLNIAWMAIGLAAPCLLGALLVPLGSPWECTAWLLPGQLLLYFYYGTVYASIQDLIPARLRGRAMAIYFCGMYVLGAVWGPAGMGWLSDLCAHGFAQQAGETVVNEWHKVLGLREALFLVPFLCLLLCIVLYMASRRVEKDCGKLPP